jgi:hypothetical protein
MAHETFGFSPKPKHAPSKQREYGRDTVGHCVNNEPADEGELEHLGFWSIDV